MEKVFLRPEKKINPNSNNPQLIKGTKEQNMICAFMGLSINSKQEITAAQFLTTFIEIQKIIYAGVKIDFQQQPGLKNSKVLEAIKALKGHDQNFLEESFFLSIVEFLCPDNKTFISEAKRAYEEFEVKLLLNEFFPH